MSGGECELCGERPPTALDRDRPIEYLHPTELDGPLGHPIHESPELLGPRSWLLPAHVQRALRRVELDVGFGEIAFEDRRAQLVQGREGELRSQETIGTHTNVLVDHLSANLLGALGRNRSQATLQMVP